MCNLYSMRKSRDELVKLFGISRVGNDVQFDFPSIYPDSMAPVVRHEDNDVRTQGLLPTSETPKAHIGAAGSIRRSTAAWSRRPHSVNGRTPGRRCRTGLPWMSSELLSLLPVFGGLGQASAKKRRESIGCLLSSQRIRMSWSGPSMRKPCR